MLFCMKWIKQLRTVFGEIPPNLKEGTMLCIDCGQSLDT